MRTRKNLKLIAPLVCAIMAAGGLVHQASGQTTTTFQPGVTPDVSYDIDAVYIRSGQGNQNDDPDLEVLVGYSGTPFRGLLEFDLSEIPSSDIVDSVSLFLKTRSNQAGSGSGQFDLYEYAYDVDETTATWAAPAVGDADPTDGGTLGALLGSVTFNSSATSAEVTFADSAAFRTAIENALAGDGFVRFLIKANNESNYFARFADENWADTSFRPKLTVQHSSSGPDLTAPGIVSESPADDTSGGFYVGTDLLLTFDEDVALTGTGTVTIVDTDDASGTQVISLPNGAVSVSGDVLTISPPSVLDGGTNYAVQISADAVVDLSTDNGGGPNAFPGILDTTTWNFTTDATDATGPVISSTDPADDATGVAPNVNLVATFDENLVLGSGNITLVDITDGSGTQVLAVPGPQVSIAGTVLTIDPATDLEGASDYAVQLDAGVVKNFSDVGNAAITDTTTWNFSVTSDTVFVSTANTSGDDTWNQGGNWDIGAAPSGSLTATISSGLTATSAEVPDTYSGGLTFEANSELDIRSGAGINALGTGPITMNDGSTLRLREGSPNPLTIANDIEFNGNVAITNSSNTTDNRTRSLTGTLSGTGQMTYSMRRGNTLNIDGANSSWSGGFVANCVDIVSSNLPNGIEPNVNGALGSGAVTLNDGVRLVINGGLGDTIGDAATLNLDGASARDGHKLVLGSDETVGLLNRNGFPYPSGTYGAIGSGATYEYSWISGSGILTVASDNGDATGPVGTIVTPADDTADVLVSEFYIVDFDEPLVRGAGNILIKNLTDATTVTIPASDPLQVAILDETRLRIDPIVNLLAGKNYAIQIEATAFEDLFGNAYAGITDDTTWNFTTVASKVVFTEDFEPPLNPDVVGYEQGSRPALWDGHSGTFGATRHGLVDKFNGVDEFGDPIPTGDWDDDGDTANTQAYRFNYTSSPGITTQEGLIGVFTLGTTYTVEFDVQQRGTDPINIGYDGRLYAFNEGGNRDNTGSAFGGDLMAQDKSEVTADGDFHTITLSVTPNPASDAGSIGKDVGVMFKDRWAGDSSGFAAGIHDNVVVTVSAETIAPTLVSIVDDASGGPVTAGDPVVYTVTFDDWMNASTIGTDDFENGSTAGITIVDVSATSDPSVYEVTVNTTSAGDLTLQIKAGAVIDDAAHNALATGAAIPDDTTITVDPATATPYDTWAAGPFTNPFTLTLPNENPDGDSLSNLLEFAFGTDPTVSDASALVWSNPGFTPGTPTVQHAFLGSGVDFTARFIRRVDHGTSGSADYALRFSSDLTDWESSADGPGWFDANDLTVLETDGDYQLVEFPYPFFLDAGPKARFFQVEVTAVPSP